jgi:hypothetical protein
MHRILPFPHKALKVSKVWNDDEVKEAYKPPGKAIADFKRVCDAMGVEVREDGA